MQFRDETNTPAAEPTPFAVEVSTPEETSAPEQVSPPEGRRDSYEPVLPPLPHVHITLPPDVRVQIPPAVMMMLQRQEVRDAIRELQFRLRKEIRAARRKEWRRNY